MDGPRKTSRCAGADSTIATPVAAAASVPSSLTSTNALWTTLEICKPRWRPRDSGTTPWRPIAKALRLRPDHAEVHIRLGVLLAEAGRLDEGVAQLCEAVRCRPDFARAHHNLGSGPGPAGQAGRGAALPGRGAAAQAGLCGGVLQPWPHTRLPGQAR